jgi:two-component sensor histidine kinase
LIFNELLSNAFKHGYPGGRSGKIAVSLQRDGARGVVLGVSDDGVGLPKGFDWESAPTLGLRLVRNLTEQIHGKLTVSCEHGSVFQLSLPATETALGVATLP